MIGARMVGGGPWRRRRPGSSRSGTASHAYLELDLVAGVEPGASVERGRLAPRATDDDRRRQPRRRLPAGALGGGRARRVPGAASPASTTPIVGPGWHDAAGDAARRRDLADRRLVRRRVRPLARGRHGARRARRSLANEIVGWPYHHDLDLTGFIDGTENPTLVEATEVAVVPRGVPGEGASILLLQQWEHDAIGWEALPVAAQEAIIGRRKADSEELDPRPPTSHVARTDQDTFGKIFRRNIAYGTLADHGTIFVGFVASSGRLEAMLESMVGIARPAGRARRP